MYKSGMTRNDPAARNFIIFFYTHKVPFVSFRRLYIDRHFAKIKADELFTIQDGLQRPGI
jgi:hypothetical protein